MKKISLFLLILIFIPVVGFCMTTRTLEADTDLRPQGWTSGAIRFKHGSIVELNERGDVISGVLARYENLLPTGSAFSENLVPSYGIILSEYLQFNMGDRITFDENGHVISGVLDVPARIHLIPKIEPLVLFKKAILFDKSGNLIKGTLANDTFLQPTGGNLFLQTGVLLKFKAKTEVIFGPNAQVIQGTIANDLSINKKIFPAGTTLQFRESDYPKIVSNT